MIVIGIKGEIGSGKSTSTEYLVDALSNNFKVNEYFHSYKLKKIVSELSNEPIEKLMSQDGKNTYIDMYDLTLGQMLQIVGDGLRELVTKDIWIKLLNNSINNSDNDIVIISDMRYINEYENIKKFDKHVTIEIIRPVNDINSNSTRNIKHRSETELNGIKMDYTVVNDGSLTDLYNKLDIIIKDIKNILNNN